jgi:hypothetical protein
MKQTTFASVAWDKKGKVTRRERFLGEMDQVLLWALMLSLIEPHYPKAGSCRSCCTVTSASSTGIRPTGARCTGSRPRSTACATR